MSSNLLQAGEERGGEGYERVGREGEIYVIGLRGMDAPGGLLSPDSLHYSSRMKTPGVATATRLKTWTP